MDSLRRRDARAWRGDGHRLLPWGSGLELKRFLSPGNLGESTLGPFGTQRSRVVT
jgi:hypothetical protein